MDLLKVSRACAFLITVLSGGASIPARGQSTADQRGQFAVIHNMQPSADGGFTLTIDYAELLTGEAATRAASEAGQSTTRGGAFIENRTKTLSTLSVPPWAQVYLRQQGQPTLVKPAVLYSLLQGEKSPFGAFQGFPFRCEGEGARCLAVRIIRRGEQALRIEQENLP